MIVERRGADVQIRAGGAPDATVPIPGSKSLTNRFLACTALADGRSRLRGASTADDVRRMLSGLAALGIHADFDRASESIDVTGCRGYPPADEADIDAGSAGTAMRFLTALACLARGRVRIDGSPRMRERPIGALVDALHELGAEIGYEGVEGYPPLTIAASGLRGGTVSFAEPPSSQFVSALLMVAPYALNDVLIRIDGELPSRPYVDMTLAVMRQMGVETLDADGRRFIVPASQRFRAGEYEIEPDASAAAYFWAAAAVTGGRVLVAGLSRSSLQGDVGFVDVLARMGCTISADAQGIAVSGPPTGKLRGGEFDLNMMPDTAQTLAVVAMFAQGETRIRNVANLRVKETDRLTALATELRKLGANVQLEQDGIRITPPAQVRPAEIDTYDDHRMAMSFAVAGLAADGVVIRDAACVSKSFPGFFDVLGSLAG